MPSWDQLLIEILFRGLLLAGAGMLVTRFIRRTSHRWRHGFSLFFLGGLCLVPLAILAGWRWEIPVEGMAQPGTEFLAIVGRGNLLVIFMVIWILGVLLQGTRLVRAHVGLFRLRREASPWEVPRDFEGLKSQLRIRRSVALAMSPTLTRPIVFGLFRPTILLPRTARGWSRDRLEWVLAHELAHVRRYDLWIQAAIQWLCVFHWPNPFAWQLARIIGQEREVAADELALEVTGNRRADYAKDLLCLVKESQQQESTLPAGSPLATAAMLGATSSKLEQRIRELMRPKSARKDWMRTVIASGGMAVLIGVGCCLVDPFSRHFPGPAPLDPEIGMRLSADTFPGD